MKKQNFYLKCDNPSTFESCEPHQVTLKRGKYLIDCYGASSSYTKQENLIGYGAHVSGVLYIREAKTLFIYVGGKGLTSNYNGVNIPGGYNGGGYGGYGMIKSDNTIYSSGGATDIRTVNCKWNSPESLGSRIIVAGGAGGWNVG